MFIVRNFISKVQVTTYIAKNKVSVLFIMFKGNIFIQLYIG